MNKKYLDDLDFLDEYLERQEMEPEPKMETSASQIIVPFKAYIKSIERLYGIKNLSDPNRAISDFPDLFYVPCENDKSTTQIELQSAPGSRLYLNLLQNATKKSKPKAE